MMKMNRVLEYLDELYPNPKCELIYHNDYELLICIVLSAQTTDKMVNSVSSELFKKYSTLEKIKVAPLDDLERILRPIGFKKKAAYVKEIATILHDNYDDKVPKDREILMKLPGVGRKTINVFLSEYYGEAAIAVDTHVERVSKRLKIASKNDDVLKVENKLMKKIPKNEWGKRHLQLVLFGRYFCKAIKPECYNCKLIDMCSEKKKNISS